MSNFHFMRIPFNNVVIRIKPLPTEIKHGTLTLEINQTVTDFDPSKFVLTEGEVICSPDKLIFDRKRQGTSLEWRTTVEIKEGDTVICDYHAVLQAFGRRTNSFEKQVIDPCWWQEGDDLFCAIRYDNLYAYIRNGVTTPLNGHYLCKSIPRELNPNLLVLQKKITDDTGYERFISEYGFETDRFEVVETCVPNTDYLNPEYTDPNEGEILNGDTIQIQKPSDRTHVKRDGSIFAIPYRGHDGLYFIQGRWVLGVLQTV